MVRNPVRTLFAALLATLLGAAPAFGADKVKIGFITTLSGPAGGIGKDMKQSVELAVEHLGGKMAGLPIEVIFGDDQRKPDVGVQLARQMIKRDKVDFVSGIIWSNIMLAVAPVVTGEGVIMVGTNAGPHQLAGEMCNKRFFTTSWQNDSTPEAMGKHLQDLGLNDVYLIAPNYAAGKDMLTGFKRYFKGRIAAEVYTKLGQQDYQAELSQLRAKNPKAVFVFLPGGMGIQFLKQYSQAGLRGQIPLYSVYTVDELSLPAVRHAALGQFETRYWSPDLDVPANKKFVSAYKKKYGTLPSFYGAQSYDGIMLINSAVVAVKGNLKDQKGMIAAMEKANYPSTRGKYSYNVNHFPIQNYYLLKAVTGPDGPAGIPVMQIQETVFKNHKDSYYKKCKMK
ncbi:MAG: ABC transporter substrate-binding protein [Betaproteobacteria bacterium]|jgi:branched-chain amino acid transport system substrate-binding protein|nr:ABC transporter substrate-binding protein [Betaproteobacteria bacterium]